MKAYVLRTGTSIAPFDDPPGEAMVLNRPMGQRRTETLERHGLEVVHIGSLDEIEETEYFLLMDYVYFSPHCFRLFYKTAMRDRTSKVLALRSNAQTEMASPMQELRTFPAENPQEPPLVLFDLYYINERARTVDPAWLRGVPAEEIPAKVRVHEVDPPFYVRVKEKTRIGMSKTYCMHIRHWTHLYLLNFWALTALPFEWFPKKLVWFLWRVLTAFSLCRAKIARRLVIKGKHCRIHPSAVVELSVLGDNVTIGPHAVVRGSYLGDGVRVNEASKILGSIVGDHSDIAWNSVVSMCVLYPRTSVGIPGLQTAMTGRETFVSSMTCPLDVKFQGGYVSVRHDGKTFRTNLTTLGPCFGHRVRIGAGVMINCGRQIPSDVDILPDPGGMLSRIPDSLAPGRTYIVKGGTLVEVEQGDGSKRRAT